MRAALLPLGIEADDEIWFLITDAVETYELLFGDAVQQAVSRGLDRYAYVRPILVGLEEGISEGLRL